MKTNIKYSVSNLLLFLAVSSISLIGFFSALGKDRDISLICALLLGVSLLGLYASLKNIQWFDISDGYITVYSPFGLVKSIELAGIQKAFKTNASVLAYKGLSINRVHIVLCLNKHVSHCDVKNAYNSKKQRYIIIPYTVLNEKIILSEYKSFCGSELTID